MKKQWMAAALLSLASATTGTAQSIGTWVTGDWERVVVEQTNGFDVAASVRATGGNGGSYLRLTQTAPGLPGAGSLRVGFLGANLSYDPQVSGALSAVAFRADLLGESSTGFDVPFFGGLRPIIRQNGQLYSVRSTTVAPTTDWATQSWDFLATDDWTLPAVGAVGVPDFSANGAPIDFGFRFDAGGTCASQTQCRAIVTEMGLDNFSVRVTRVPPVSVPEPSTVVLLTAGLAGLFMARRRAMTLD